MHTAELTFRFPGGHDVDEALEGVDTLLHALRMNGQALGREFPVARQGDEYHVYLMLPQPDSLEEAHRNKWVASAYERLSRLDLQSCSVRLLGDEPEAAEPCDCDSRCSLILYTTCILLESSLRCGDCFGSVPLYAVPATVDDGFHDLISWQSDYRACDRLQMNCATGERFGLREMGRHDSSLSQRGRAICRTLEASLGIPVYYYLHRYRGKGARYERERRCPSCGGEWLLDEKLHNLFDFQCRPCRLLSNIAFAS